MPKEKTQDLRAHYYWSQVKKHGAKYPHFHWPSVEIILNLVYTYDVISGDMARKMASHGITKAAFSVLMILSRSESKSAKQNEISQLMLVSRANITGLVDGLVRMGLVKRTNDPHDRRVNMVIILPKGEKLIENLLPGYYKYIQDMCSVLSAEDKKILSELLTRLRNKVSASKG
jgi:MarR family 2-MHQ and catechol resistance regulon transcriptional repressor